MIYCKNSVNIRLARIEVFCLLILNPTRMRSKRRIKIDSPLPICGAFCQYGPDTLLRNTINSTVLHYCAFFCDKIFLICQLFFTEIHSKCHLKETFCSLLIWFTVVYMCFVSYTLHSLSLLCSACGYSSDYLFIIALRSNSAQVYLKMNSMPRRVSSFIFWKGNNIVLIQLTIQIEKTNHRESGLSF